MAALGTGGTGSMLTAGCWSDGNGTVYYNDIFSWQREDPLPPISKYKMFSQYAPGYDDMTDDAPAPFKTTLSVIVTHCYRPRGRDRPWTGKNFHILN